MLSGILIRFLEELFICLGSLRENETSLLVFQIVILEEKIFYPSYNRK